MTREYHSLQGESISMEDRFTERAFCVLTCTKRFSWISLISGTKVTEIVHSALCEKDVVTHDAHTRLNWNQHSQGFMLTFPHGTALLYKTSTNTTTKTSYSLWIRTDQTCPYITLSQSLCVLVLTSDMPWLKDPIVWPVRTKQTISNKTRCRWWRTCTCYCSDLGKNICFQQNEKNSL